MFYSLAQKLPVASAESVCVWYDYEKLRKTEGPENMMAWLREREHKVGTWSSWLHCRCARLASSVKLYRFSSFGRTWPNSHSSHAMWPGMYIEWTDGHCETPRLVSTSLSWLPGRVLRRNLVNDRNLTPPPEIPKFHSSGSESFHLSVSARQYTLSCWG